jgi:NAD(P)-dependent dehydrogenase (short-subunit alcohol dehydrogenase family)
MANLAGKVALVTGGAVRLGRAIATALADAGARVAITYNSSATAAELLASEMAGVGREVLALQADFSQIDRIPDVIGRVAGTLGRLDILVNNAAIFEHGDWDDTTEDNWDRHLDINLKAPFFLSQAFARNRRRAGERGHIVNIADWRAVRPGADHIAYTLAKAGIVAMTKSLALALAPEIQVNAIAPGLILPPPGASEAFLQAKAADIPAKRTGSAEEIAKAVLYLVDADFVTGDLLYVTGGEHL